MRRQGASPERIEMKKMSEFATLKEYDAYLDLLVGDKEGVYTRCEDYPCCGHDNGSCKGGVA